MQMGAKVKEWRNLDYSEMVRRLFMTPGEDAMNICREITFQVTGSCTLCCSYCYENHKSCGVMSEQTGRKIVDYILDMYAQDDPKALINHQTKSLVLSFIGGEPLLEAQLIERIGDYYFEQCFRRDIPLAPYTRISFATNGQLWFTEEAQHLIRKYHEFLSVTVSIDGVKELHDAFRVDAEGNGSFDKAYAAFLDGKQKYGWMASKMTFVPESTKYLYPSVKMMVEEGCQHINCNYAYEPYYTVEDAREVYRELVKLSDWLIEAAPDAYVSILHAPVGTGMGCDDRNYCGGTGNMISFAPDGKAYPCIRYAPISIGVEKASRVCLGSCWDGLYATDEQRKTKEMLDSITRSSQSSQECMTCPVMEGCGWCSAYNYELYGTPNKRNTNICYCHKGRVLASCYYYAKKAILRKDVEPKEILLPYEEVEMILGVDDARALFELVEKAKEVSR